VPVGIDADLPAPGPLGRERRRLASSRLWADVEQPEQQDDGTVLINLITDDEGVVASASNEGRSTLV